MLRLYQRDFAELPEDLSKTATALELSSLPNLRIARGLETMVSLEEIAFYGVPALDWDDFFARASKLPGLTRLVLGRDDGREPPSFAGMHALLELVVHAAATRDLGALFAKLEKLEGLRILTLKSDDPITLPDSIARLGQLRELRVGMCSQLPDALTRMTALEVLACGAPYAKRKRIKALPKDIGQMRSLRALHLRGHRVESLPESFWDLHELRSLDLFGSTFSGLSERLGELTKLEDVDLNYCEKLASLPESIGQLTALRSFFAMGTALTTLPESFHRLRLEHCELPPALIATVKLAPPEVTYVENLVVNRPHDHALPDDLGDPVKLTIYAPLVDRPATAFSKLTRLESLSMQRAPAFDLGDALARLTGTPLSRLYLSDWQLEVLPKEIGRLVHLKELHLGGNRLATLPDEIGALTQLEELGLGANPFTRFPASCAALTALAALSLSKLEALPRNLSLLTGLKKLSLNHFQGKQLSEELEGLVNLQELDLSSAGIDDLRIVAKLPSLQTLDLTWYHGKLDAEVFRALARTPIRNLTLRYARSLDVLPPEIGELQSLRTLDVRSTNVHVLRPEIAKLSELQQVHFQDFMIKPAELKKQLPPGKWRKAGSGNHTSYVRSA